MEIQIPRPAGLAHLRGWVREGDGGWRGGLGACQVEEGHRRSPQESASLLPKRALSGAAGWPLACAASRPRRRLRWGVRERGFAGCPMHSSSRAQAVTLWAGPLGFAIALEKPGGRGCNCVFTGDSDAPQAPGEPMGVHWEVWSLGCHVSLRKGTGN